MCITCVLLIPYSNFGFHYSQKLLSLLQSSISASHQYTNQTVPLVRLSPELVNISGTNCTFMPVAHPSTLYAHNASFEAQTRVGKSGHRLALPTKVRSSCYAFNKSMVRRTVVTRASIPQVNEAMNGYWFLPLPMQRKSR